MPAPATANEFWSLAISTRLIDAGAADMLRQQAAAELDAKAADTPKAVAQFLLGRGAITRWQAKRLLGGNTGPYFFGDYRLLERHERPGESLLFTARHDPSGRTVSLSLLQPKRCRQVEVWTEIVRRTTAAHQAADAMLSRTWALEQADGQRFIVAEAVRGEPLAEELARLGPMPAMQAGVLMSQVAKAVAELHALGIVHGGLSLETLIREPGQPGAADRTGRVRLLQFPLVDDPHLVPLRPMLEGDANVANLGRRASFIAPELMLPDHACDMRTDVYSLGCMLYALLSGRLPCWRDEPRQTLQFAALAGPEPLGPPAVAPELAALIGYMTARDPAARYPSAADVADAIAASFGLAPAAAPRPAAALVTAAAAPVADAAAAASAPFFPTATAAPANVGFTVEDRTATPPQVTLSSDKAAAPGTRAARKRAAGLQMLGMAAAAVIVAGAIGFVLLSSGTTEDEPDTPAADPQRQAAAETDPKPTGTGAKPTADIPAETAVSAETPPAGGKPTAADKPARPQVSVVSPDVQDVAWESPTKGGPPSLAYLPPGSQLVLLARPAEIMEDDEGTLFAKALGPEVEAALAQVAKFCDGTLEDIETIQVGWQADDDDSVLVGYAVRLTESKRIPDDEGVRKTLWGDTTAEKLADETIHVGPTWSFWVPKAGRRRFLVVAPKELLTLIVEEGPPPADDDQLAASIPKDLEVLVGMLDRSRHITLFGSTAYLQNKGQSLLAGPLAKLAEPLRDFFGESLTTAALSLHFGGNFYAELDTVPTFDDRSKQVAPRLTKTVEDLADSVEEYCGALNANPYGRILVLRLPSMIRSLAGNLRSAAEGRGVVLNAYLPKHAGHNLALATELALAQTPGGGGAAAPQAAVAAAPKDALGKLKKKMTLVFAKDTLEKSIQMISDEIGVPMEIQGPDLQLEGITKNQSFGLDEKDKTAEEILRVILAKANPDGKLVFIVRMKDGVESIDISTRASAEKRGDKLPPGFEPAAKSASK